MFIDMIHHPSWPLFIKLEQVSYIKAVRELMGKNETPVKICPSINLKKRILYSVVEILSLNCQYFENFDVMVNLLKNIIDR